MHIDRETVISFVENMCAQSAVGPVVEACRRNLACHMLKRRWRALHVYLKTSGDTWNMHVHIYIYTYTISDYILYKHSNNNKSA